MFPEVAVREEIITCARHAAWVVIRVQFVAETDIIDERGGAQLQVDVADDSSISLPARIDAERQLIFTGAVRVRRKVCDRHLDHVRALPALAGAIEFVGYVGAHGSKLGAVYRNPAKISDGIEVQHGALVRRKLREEKIAAELIVSRRTQ